MSSFITWFEIPVTDFARAVAFYEHVFQIQLEQKEMHETYKMAYFPPETNGVEGALCCGEGYIPAGNGTLLYMNGNPDMEALLHRVSEKEGRVLVPKTLVSEEQGYFGCFLDSENNKIGLHSMK
jgi:uncharacterized protein